MADDLTYKHLRDLAREEKSQPGLVALPDGFYSSVAGFLEAKSGEMEAERSVMRIREFENAVATIREISQIRQQKILFKAIRNGGSHHPGQEMTREEHELYDRFCSVLEDSRQGLESLLSRYSGRKEEGEKTVQAAAAGSSLKKVRFLKDVPAYRGPNNETFGPYRPGEESSLPQSEADWLLRGKLAESA